VDIIPDWRLDEDLSRYPLVVVPDWPDIGALACDALITYARRGGRLLVIGAENAGLFAKDLRVRLTGPPGKEPSYVRGKEVLGNISGLWQKVDPEGAQSIETRYSVLDTTRDGFCAATLTDCDSGKLAAIYGPLGSIFASFHAAANREFLDRVVRRQFSPQVEIDGPPTIEVALRKKASKTILHMANATAMQVAGDYAVNDYVPPIGPVKISIRLPERPRRVTLEPGGALLAGSWENGTWTGVLDKLEIHAMVLF
jgi:hypothetical protein